MTWPQALLVSPGVLADGRSGLLFFDGPAGVAQVPPEGI
jgi:hypothetical protein